MFNGFWVSICVALLSVAIIGSVPQKGPLCADLIGHIRNTVVQLQLIYTYIVPVQNRPPWLSKTSFQVGGGGVSTSGSPDRLAEVAGHFGNPQSQLRLRPK